MDKPERASELQLKIRIDKMYKIDLADDLNIDTDNINEELSNQPALFAWHGVVAEFAKAKTLQIKNELEVLRAELDQAIRKRAKDNDEKITEAGIEAVVRLTTSYRGKEALYLEAKKNEGILGVALEAFRQKKDMLISVASNMRAEKDTELSINKKKVADKIKQIRNGQGD